MYFFNMINLNISSLVAIFLLILDIFSLIKHKNNMYLFFLFLCIFYFDFSVICSKYLFQTNTLVSVYNQINQENIMMLSISLLFVFHSIIEIVLLLERKNREVLAKKDNIKDKDVLTKKEHFSILFLIGIIGSILIGYYILQLKIIPRTIYEYLLILYVILFYLIKKSNKNFYKNFAAGLVLFSFFMSTIEGARVVALQPIIAYLFSFYIEKMSQKRMLLVFILVIILYTTIGVYGDFLDYGYNLKDFNITYMINVFIQRKFTLDTAISSYWTGITYIMTAHKFDISFRLKNFIEFISTYAILGSKSSYLQLQDISICYYVHYFGGFIFSYFYFWLGWLGMVIGGTYIGKLLKFIKNNTTDTSVQSPLMKIIPVYIVASFPRWYLYFPTPLFRGMIMLIVLTIIFCNNKRRI